MILNCFLSRVIGIVLGASVAIAILFSISAHATQITIPVTWATGDTVTNAKLNSINNTFGNAINGGLDNTNMASGYNLFQKVGALPAAGNQGAVDFLSSDNSLNIDTGAAWVKTITPTGTPQTGSIPYYNSSWTLLNPSSSGQTLTSNGSSSLPTYQGMTTQGDIEYYNGSARTRLGPGTSGQVLQTQGAGANPQWTNDGLVPISQTTLTAVATSGNISITNGNTYFVKFNFVTFSGADSVFLRFNADSGSHYKYMNKALDTAASSANSVQSTGDTKIPLEGGTVGNGQGIQGAFYIQQLGTTTQIYNIWGQSMYTTNVGSTFETATVTGQWTNAANVTSFSILTSGGATVTGVVDLYQVSAG